MTDRKEYIKTSKFRPVKLLDGIEEIKQDFEERIAQGDTTYGIEILDDAVETIRKGSITFIIAAPNCLDLNTNVLTTEGFKSMRDITPNDTLISREGKPCNILSITNTDLIDCYEIELADGRKITASYNHKWVVSSAEFQRKEKVVTSEQLFDYVNRPYLKNKIYIPKYEGNHGHLKNFIIPPYVLGVLLGDGCLTCRGLVYCKPDRNVLRKIKKWLPSRDIEIKKNKNVSIKNSRDLTLELERLELKVRSYEKFIPRDYIDGVCKEQRLQLLEGLLDTDGNQQKSYNEYSTTSYQLALDVQQLAWSLGYRCTIKSRMGRYKKEGTYKETRLNYRVYISNKRTKEPNIIKSCKKVEPRKTKCVTVDTKDNIFVGEGYTLLRNTGKSLCGQTIAVHLAKQNKKVLICSCEMGAGLLMERQIKQLLGVSSGELRKYYSSDKTNATKLMDELIESDQYRYLNNIYISETGGATIEDIKQLMDIFPEFEYVIIDYIQRIRGNGTEYENITNAARELQTYARDTGRKLIVCSQASRQSSTDVRQGKELDPSRIRGKGSGSIEEDGDVGLSLIEDPTNNTSDKIILFTLFKNRYGSLKNISYRYKLSSRLTFDLIQRNC